MTAHRSGKHDWKLRHVLRELFRKTGGTIGCRHYISNFGILRSEPSYTWVMERAGVED